jgi:hypothetical protein
MAGAYGKLNSKSDYYRTLDEALATAEHYIAFGPSPVIETIKRQLEEMKRWTANGRAPTDDEKDRINVGLIGLRELQDGNPGDKRIERWTSQLSELNNYFEGWPSDHIASSATQSETDRIIDQRAMRMYQRKKQKT